jgi:hypothetical protein
MSELVVVKLITAGSARQTVSDIAPHKGAAVSDIIT